MRESADGSSAENGTQNQSPADVARMHASHAHFSAGQPVPNREMWVLERKLGGGGFGEVWLARHEWKDERVAVKFCMHPDLCHKLVTHEKKIVARVMKHGGDHPNVVPLVDCNLTGQIPWLMYEYVAGGTLADVVVQWQPLSPADRTARAIRTLYAIACALSRFHRLDPPIVHRDLKPHNVLMAGEVPRLTDFGIGGAAVEVTTSGAVPATDFSVQLPTMLKGAGSLRYASPEQTLGNPPAPRDDVFALGVIAYQLLVGNLKVTPTADAADELRDLDVPADLVALVVRSVSNKPDRRPEDALEWERRLVPLLGPQPVPTPVPVVNPSPDPTHTSTYTSGEEEFKRGEDALHGRGVPPSFDDACVWYEKAVSRGHAEAAFVLGLLFYHGRGVPQDYTRAREWWEKAAARGHIKAQFGLGEIYHNGQGVPRSYAQAREWWEKAAEQGHVKAQYTLGHVYDYGQGVAEDFLQARRWYARAAAQGSEEASCALGWLSYKGQGTPQDYENARLYWERSAGLADSQYGLANLYENGHGVSKDLSFALHFYRRAAAKGNALAEMALKRLSAPGA